MNVGTVLKMGPREFADRSDTGWEKKVGVKDNTEVCTWNY